MKYVTVHKKRIFTEEAGKNNRRKLICINGIFSAGCNDFLPIMKDLSKRHHLITFDTYGTMHSDGIDSNFLPTPDNQADILEELRIAFNIEKWSLLSHGTGAIVAMKYASKYPDNVETMIYENPSFFFTRSILSIIEYFKNYFIKEKNTKLINECESILNTNYSGHEKDLYDKMISLSNNIKDLSYRNFLRKTTYKSYFDSFMPANDMVKQKTKNAQYLTYAINNKEFYTDYLPLLKNIDKPSLIMKAYHDPVCDAYQKNIFMRDALQPHTKSFNDSGHFIRLDEKIKYAQTVNTFLYRYIP